MGTFPIPPPNVPHSSVASINMISTSPHELPTSYDPWIVPDPGDHIRFGEAMLLSPVESAYQTIQSTTPSTPSFDELSPDLFRVVHFPHQGKVVTIDQLAFFNSDTRNGNVPFIAKTPPGYENVGVCLLKDSSLMGTFPIPPPNIPCSSVASINMISTVPYELPTS